MSIDNIKKNLKRAGNRKDIEILKRFFKTKPGEYGAEDVFIGVRVPLQRLIAKKYSNTSLKEVERLLQSKIHEYRLTALLILIEKYSWEKQKERERIYDLYLRNIKKINNWDLVDLSAYKIVGRHIFENNLDEKILFILINDNNLWARRIAIVSSFYFIKKGEYKLSFKLIKQLLNDEEDLIHKSSGWMLREVGKNCGIEKEEIFLKKYYKKMPRTMLRYSLEKFPKDKKEFYMKK